MCRICVRFFWLHGGVGARFYSAGHTSSPAPVRQVIQMCNSTPCCNARYYSSEHSILLANIAGKIMTVSSADRPTLSKATMKAVSNILALVKWTLQEISTSSIL